MSDYYNDEIKSVLPVDQYGVSFKVRSTTGETKWLEFNHQSYQALTGNFDALNRGNILRAVVTPQEPALTMGKITQAIASVQETIRQYDMGHFGDLPTSEHRQALARARKNLLDLKGLLKEFNQTILKAASL